jgi:radical SAM protein with 4Fe4S-binding SPASM domain
MQMTDSNQKYVVNPAYKFKEDYLNVIITNNNTARYDNDDHREDITSFFAWRTHPDLAYQLSYFDGSRTLDDIARIFSTRLNIGKEEFLATVRPCICNEDSVLIPVHQQHWVPIPKNFLIPNTTGILRKDLLAKVNIPFIRKNYDLSEVRLRVPNNMTFMLNTTCATDCIYCYADRPKIQRPLPFSRIQTLLEEAYNLEIPYVDVNGGDFFVYPYWREMLIEMLKYDYMPTISTKCPLDESMVKTLRNLGVNKIQLSIDSVNPQEMCQMLNVKKNYMEKVLNGLHLLDKAGLNITIKPVITKYNDSEKSVNDTIDLLTTFKNVRSISFTPAEFSQFKVGKSYFSTRDQLTRLETIVEQRNRDCDTELYFLGYEKQQSVEQRKECFPHRSICTGNVHGFFILPDGKVTLCEQIYWHPFFILGDLKRQSIMEMWNSELALSKWNFSQDEVRETSPCKRCEDFETCRRGLGNCWRLAISAYGPESYDFPSPDCPKAPPVPDNFYID